MVKRLKEANAFMCLEWSDVELQGEDPAYNTRTIDVMFLPCNMKETLLGDATEDDRIS